MYNKKGLGTFESITLVVLVVLISIIILWVGKKSLDNFGKIDSSVKKEIEQPVRRIAKKTTITQKRKNIIPQYEVVSIQQDPRGQLITHIFVYTSYISFSDKQSYIRIGRDIGEKYYKNRNYKILFFSSKNYTPSRMPLSESEIRCWIGNYYYRKGEKDYMEFNDSDAAENETSTAEEEYNKLIDETRRIEEKYNQRTIEIEQEYQREMAKIDRDSYNNELLTGVSVTGEQFSMTRDQIKERNAKINEWEEVKEIMRKKRCTEEKARIYLRIQQQKQREIIQNNKSRRN